MVNSNRDYEENMCCLEMCRRVKKQGQIGYTIFMLCPFCGRDRNRMDFCDEACARVRYPIPGRTEPR